jgi:ADP-dependent phosphofructokinase/glucokinase
VQLLTSGDELTGVIITFENIGGTAASAEYVVGFSDDTTFSLNNDKVVYRANISIAAGRQELVELDMDDDINPYISSRSVIVPAGTYHLGV